MKKIFLVTVFLLGLSACSSKNVPDYTVDDVVNDWKQFGKNSKLLKKVADDCLNDVERGEPKSKACEIRSKALGRIEMIVLDS